MNFERVAIVLRERGPLEVVDLAIRFVRVVAPPLLLKLTALTLLPPLGLVLALRYSFELPWWQVWLVAAVLSWFCELPFLCAFGDLLLGRVPRLGQVFARAAGLAIPFAVALAIEVFLLTLVSPTAVGPLFVAATYCFWAEAIVLERASAWSALGRARSFLRGRSGTGMETVFLKACLTTSFVLLGETLGQAVWSFGLDINASSEELIDDGGSPFALFGLFAAVPLGTAYRFLSYINERTRQDAWDVQVAFLALARERSVVLEELA